MILYFVLMLLTVTGNGHRTKQLPAFVQQRQYYPEPAPKLFFVRDIFEDAQVERNYPQNTKAILNRYHDRSTLPPSQTALTLMTTSQASSNTVQYPTLKPLINRSEVKSPSGAVASSSSSSFPSSSSLPDHRPPDRTNSNYEKLHDPSTSIRSVSPPSRINHTGHIYKNISLVPSILRDEPWIGPMIALSLVNTLVVLIFECFVLYRACQSCPSKRHFLLGQNLLLGLLMSSLIGIAFVPNPSWATCTAIRAAVGVSFAFVYGTLLVKTVFLHSIHRGVHLPTEYQALLLFFVIGTQVAIDGQWLVHRNSSLVVDYMDGFGQAVYKCDHSINQLLFSLGYVMFLLLLLCMMTLRVRSYRENHGEGMYLMLTAFSSLLLWLVWIAGMLTSTHHYRDGFIAFGVVGNATLVFCFMFLPKGRQLIAVGREGLATDEQLSSASSPSIYTPSFMHIKPLAGRQMSKPSITGLGQVMGVSNGIVSSASAYGLSTYQQFQGTGTTALTSPVSATGPPSLFTAAGGIPTSFSSHAIFQRTKLMSPSFEETEEDPAYSNVGNVFATATSGQHRRSPGSGSDENGGSSQASKLSKATSSERSNHSQLKHHHPQNQRRQNRQSRINSGTFYLQSPPPLPTVQPPAQLPSTLRGAWRQSSYTAHSTRTNGHKSGGGGGGGGGQQHPHSTAFKSNSVAGTPMTGVMPPGPFQVLTPTLVESALESKLSSSNNNNNNNANTFNGQLTKRHFKQHF